MALMPLTAPAEIAATLDTLARRLAEGAVPVRRTLAGREQTLHWRRREGFWAAVEPRPAGCHSCALGTADPTREEEPAIVCQLGPAVEGASRSCPGVFLRDPSGRIYLAHTGDMEGGKEAFAAFHRNADWRWVTWPDGAVTTALVIGHLGYPRLAGQIGGFVHVVERFRRTCRPSQQSGPSSSP